MFLCHTNINQISQKCHIQMSQVSHSASKPVLTFLLTGSGVKVVVVKGEAVKFTSSLSTDSTGNIAVAVTLLQGVDIVHDWNITRVTRVSVLHV